MSFPSQYLEDPARYRESRIHLYESSLRIVSILFIMLFAPGIFPSHILKFEFYFIGVTGILALGISLYFNINAKLTLAKIISIVVNHYVITGVIFFYEVSADIFFWASFYLVTIILSTVYFQSDGVILTSALTFVTVLLVPLMQVNLSLSEFRLFLIFFVITSSLLVFSKYHLDTVFSDIEKNLRRSEYFSKMESLGRLTGGVAHDFNNILMAITTRAELIKLRYGDNEEVDKDIDQIINSAERGTDIVEQLLYYSKQNAKEDKIIDLIEKIEDTSYLLETVLQDSIELQIEFPEYEEMYVKLNQSQLTQILLNLAVNSADAIEGDGKFRIDVSLASIDELLWTSINKIGEQKFVKIEVSDTGSGIEKDKLQKIFDPFYTTKSFEKGTGLGLSTVYGIVRNADGAIVTESKIGEGTIFSLFFPLVEQPEELIDVEEISENKPDIENLSIMIVEDNKDLSDSLVSILENKGLTVSTAYDGYEALQEIEKNNGEYEVILSDIKMPKMSGLELWEEIDDRGYSVNFILMSAYSSELLNSEEKYKGVPFLSKPFSIDDLFAIIHDNNT